MLEIIKTKEMKSTTKVEGILVQTSDKQWYAITRLMPPRFGWYLRCSPSTSTGRMSFGNEIYMYPTGGSKPEFQEGIDELMNVLNNGKKGKMDPPNYNQR